MIESYFDNIDSCKNVEISQKPEQLSFGWW